MWKDESFGIPNRALLKLLPDPEAYHSGNQREFLSQFTLWTDDFKKTLGLEEFPIIELCRSQVRFESKRVGIQHPRTNTRLIYEVHGEPIRNDSTGEFLGGIVIFKDVTEYTKRIAAQLEENEKQFEYICNLIPIMVWRTTPTGQHDWFSQRWYDYTGLTEEQSLGMGWRLPFHPDDMPETSKRWAHSLATGDEYITEYRCQRRDGEWRWMLGRAVPFYDEHGTTIVKWFGTCTDIHELVEARQAAKDTREQLLKVIDHARVTLWAVNTELDLVLLEGSLLRPCAPSHAQDGQPYIGRKVDDVFGKNPFAGPMQRILKGESKEDIVSFVSVKSWSCF
jgi:PAS domain S-box-containing protein